MEPSVTPLLERWGLRVLRSSSAPRSSTAENPIHVLDAEEQRALARVERSAVARAATVGALSALASGITEALAGVHFRLDHEPTLADLAAFGSLYGAVTLVASVLEIAYLYWDALRSVRVLAAEAGLDLASGTSGSRDVASALARAALELPETDEPVLGVDPRRESKRWMLLVASVVYKLKVGISSFLLKSIVRRALGRFATRQLLAFGAVPVNALWNAAVTFLVLREARVRVMGPSAVEAWLPSIVPSASTISENGRRAIVRAAASSIVRSEIAHPNLVVLLRRILETIGPFDEEFVLDDTALFLEHLRELPDRERSLVLEVTVAAVIVDGKIARNERRLLAQAFEAAGRTLSLDAIEAARRDFVRGRSIALSRLAGSPDGPTM